MFSKQACNEKHTQYKLDSYKNLMNILLVYKEARNLPKWCTSMEEIDWVTMLEVKQISTYKS